MNEKLAARWQELVAAVEEECWNHSHNPDGGILKVEESPFKLSLPLSADERCSRTFEEDEILNGDLRQLAREFYAHYKSGCE